MCYEMRHGRTDRMMTRCAKLSRHFPEIRLFRSISERDDTGEDDVTSLEYLTLQFWYDMLTGNVREENHESKERDIP